MSDAEHRLLDQLGAPRRLAGSDRPYTVEERLRTLIRPTGGWIPASNDAGDAFPYDEQGRTITG